MLFPALCAGAFSRITLLMMGVAFTQMMPHLLEMQQPGPMIQIKTGTPVPSAATTHPWIFIQIARRINPIHSSANHH